MDKEKFVQIREIRGPKSAEWADAKMWVITTDFLLGCAKKLVSAPKCWGGIR